MEKLQAYHDNLSLSKTSIVKNITMTLNAFKAEGKALTYYLTSTGKDNTHFLITYANEMLTN